ncbi:MAG: substrate-binding domain-containing protein [Candidatus Paceibacterota bacterium]|jgi:ABC-type molybdate transport system substrate-binding protein
MLLRNVRNLALAVSASVLISQSVQAAPVPSTITITVSPVAANALADLVADFLNDFPVATYGYSISLQVVPDDEAKAGIISGNAVPDLFLSQSFVAPEGLLIHHPELVSGKPFAYAQDPLVFYSSAEKNVDVSQGVPTLNNLQKFSIPDPASLDPYGIAATLLLNKTYVLALSKQKVLKTPDATTSFAAVEYLPVAAGGTAYGFTGKSQICSAIAGTEEFEPGSSHYEFTNVVPILLAGIKIAKPSRTQEQEAELADFISFLSTGAGRNNFIEHCFRIPSF